MRALTTDEMGNISEICPDISRRISIEYFLFSMRKNEARERKRLATYTEEKHWDDEVVSLIEKGIDLAVGE
jgi:hypothetical protein